MICANMGRITGEESKEKSGRKSIMHLQDKYVSFYDILSFFEV